MSGLHEVVKPSPKVRRRSPALDLLKIVACVLVVVIHVTAEGVTGYQAGGWLQRLTVVVNSLSQFAVPAFIFASGYGLAARFKGAERVGGLLGFWVKRLDAVLLPYLIWSMIYLLYQQRFVGICYGAAGMLRLVLTGGAFYHLYFMVILIQFYLLFPALLWFRRRFSKKYVDVAAVAVLFVVYAIWLKGFVPLSDRFFMTYLPFFYAGLVAFQAPPKGRFLTGLGIVGAVAFADYLVTRMAAFRAITPLTMLSLPFAWELFSLAAILLLLAWLKTFNIDERRSVWVSRLAGTTFDVYLAHPLVLAFVALGLRAAGVQSLSLRIALGFVLGLTVPGLVRLGYNALEDRYGVWWGKRKDEKQQKKSEK